MQNFIYKYSTSSINSRILKVTNKSLSISSNCTYKQYNKYSITINKSKDPANYWYDTTTSDTLFLSCLISLGVWWYQSSSYMMKLPSR